MPDVIEPGGHVEQIARDDARGIAVRIISAVWDDVHPGGSRVR